MEHKLCGESISLAYGRRSVYIAGLDDLIAKPVLLMEQEFSREYTWTDWKGARYNLIDEWKYVNGPAITKEHCTPGTRDVGRGGMLPSDFMHAINEHIARRRRDGFGSLPSEHASLTLEEVLACRLYSGPAYQPINEFLRQVAKLDGRTRTAMARHPFLTYSATVGHICSAIRKIAAVETPEEASTTLYRSVRGVLPRTFWTPEGGKDDMVMAVDMGFMSTSRSKSTAISYMHQMPGLNVLWQLEPKAESDEAFHRGANIAMLSQFESEQEVLFPPCTMLRVHPRVLRGDVKLFSRWDSGDDLGDDLQHGHRDDARHDDEHASEEMKETHGVGVGITQKVHQHHSGHHLTHKAPHPHKEYFAKFRATDEVHGNRRFLRVVVLPSFL